MDLHRFEKSGNFVLYQLRHTQNKSIAIGHIVTFSATMLSFCFFITPQYSRFLKRHGICPQILQARVCKHNYRHHKTLRNKTHKCAQNICKKSPETAALRCKTRHFRPQSMAFYNLKHGISGCKSYTFAPLYAVFKKINHKIIACHPASIALHRSIPHIFCDKT